MKKLLVRILIVIALSVMLLTAVFAEGNTYYIPELDAEMTIPEGYCVVTRDTPEDDPVFSNLFLTHSEFMEYFEEWYVYLDAIAYDISEEIVVTMETGEFADLNNPLQLNMLIASLEDISFGRGSELLQSEVYQHQQTTMLKLYYHQDENDAYSLQYYTSNTEKAYSFTLRSYGSQISSAQEDRMKLVVDSVKFDASQVTRQKSPSLFLYTDHAADVSFTVPGNWEKGQSVEVEGASGLEFYSSAYPENSIFYWSSDLWEEQADEEKEKTPRTEINNAYVTKADVAEMYDVTRDEVFEVTYNGAAYFKVVTDAETAPVTQLVRFSDGWMYEFEFVGTEEDAAYADFEKLMGSVKYPVAAEAEPTEPNIIEAEQQTEEPQTKTDTGSYAMIMVALAILAAVGIAVLVVGIIMENRKKQEQREPGMAFACKACGHMLPADSRFCSKCGCEIKDI